MKPHGAASSFLFLSLLTSFPSLIEKWISSSVVWWIMWLDRIEKTIDGRRYQDGGVRALSNFLLWRGENEFRLFLSLSFPSEYQIDNIDLFIDQPKTKRGKNNARKAEVISQTWNEPLSKSLHPPPSFPFLSSRLTQAKPSQTRRAKRIYQIILPPSNIQQVVSPCWPCPAYQKSKGTLQGGGFLFLFFRLKKSALWLSPTERPKAAAVAAGPENPLAVTSSFLPSSSSSSFFLFLCVLTVCVWTRRSWRGPSSSCRVQG